MAEMAELLEEVAAGKARPVVLIEGDEYLARTSARELADAIVPEKDRALNLVILDAAAGAREIASHLLTVAMFPAPKAVLVEGADAFAEEVDAARELSRARDLWQGKRPRDAARRLGSGGGGVRLEDRRVGGEVAQGDRRGARGGGQRVAAGAFRLGAGPERRRAAGRSGGAGQDGGAGPSSQDAPDPGGGVAPPKARAGAAGGGERRALEAPRGAARPHHRHPRHLANRLRGARSAEEEAGPRRRGRAEEPARGRPPPDRLGAAQARALRGRARPDHAGGRGSGGGARAGGGVLRAGASGGRGGRRQGPAALRRRAAAQGERIGGGAPVPGRSGERRPQGPGRQRAVRRIRGARARLQRVPGQALSCPGGGALREEAEGAASVRRVAGLQAGAEKAARILAPGAGALRGGGLRAEGRRRSAVVRGAPAGLGVRAVNLD